MRYALRLILFVTIAAVILYFMQRYDLIDFRMLSHAFQKGSVYIIELLFTHALVFSLLMYRYSLLVRATGVHAELKDVMAASFVSQSVGQWAPGSLAVIEMIRMGLMFGSKAQTSHKDTSLHVSAGIRARLIAASLADRLIGFWVILSVGAVISLLLLLWKLRVEGINGRDIPGITALTLFSIFGSTAIFAMPFFATKKIVIATIHKITSYLEPLRHKYNHPIPKIVFHKSYVFVHHLDRFRELIAVIWASRKHFRVPILLSLSCVFLSCTTLYLGSLAVGGEINFLAILATFPVIAVASLLPIGFGGMGGYQLVAAAVFNVFSVSAPLVTSANLLQNALSLIVSTILGLIFAKISYQQLKEILRQRKTTATINNK